MSFEKTRRLKHPPLSPPEALVGKRVASLAGRDRGRTYTVQSVYTDGKGKTFALLSGGNDRTEDRPKRKALAHLACTDQTENGNGGN